MWLRPFRICLELTYGSTIASLGAVEIIKLGPLFKCFNGTEFKFAHLNTSVVLVFQRDPGRG